MKFKDYQLKKGDTVAVISPSSGKASKFPSVYLEGIKNLKKVFGLNVKEYPTTQMSSEELHKNPSLRAKDINDAFKDKEIKGIITAIGGDDSVRILPYLDDTIIRNNKKLFMGFSDATVLLSYIHQLGLITFHGPSIMCGFAQSKNLPVQFIEHVNTMLFENFDKHSYQPYTHYCDGYKDWKEPNTKGGITPLKKNQSWQVINTGKNVKGQLFGGCIEALEFIKGTKYWPEPSFWDGKVLFLETSEEKPSINQVKYMLRNYGTQGIFNKIVALLFGRANFYTAEEKDILKETISQVVIDEFKANHLPILANVDFGHTDPQVILPIGVNLTVKTKEMKLILHPTE